MNNPELIKVNCDSVRYMRRHRLLLKKYLITELPKVARITLAKCNVMFELVDVIFDICNMLTGHYTFNNHQ